MTDANGNMVMPVAPYYGGNNGDGMYSEAMRMSGYPPRMPY